MGEVEVREREEGRDEDPGLAAHDAPYRDATCTEQARHDKAGQDEAGKPARLGRFVVIEHLGQGGMGVVYSAYDPELDRRVALKILRPAATHGGHNRLLREAQALARLSHPNIVPVHDVGMLEDRVFLVMEFVDGQTLRTWVTKEPRSWQEILAVYRQAGEGLAAAHQLGVVHRDFKPENALVGSDMRVRVIDFGLARAFRHETDAPAPPGGVPEAHAPFEALDLQMSPFESTYLAELPDASPIASGSEPRLDSPLTATRAVMGTPAYMSPEQFISARVGPSSDLFSFCVSLYEALYGERPFAGDSIDEVRENMLLGRVRPPGDAGKAPGWVHAVLCRGLQPEPADRYPSMQALLAALSPAPPRARRWLPMAWGLLAAALVSGYALSHGLRADAPACGGASEQLGQLWSPERRASLWAAFSRTGSAYAAQSFARVGAALDRHAEEWTRVHTEACEAHQRGEQSAYLFNARTLCLERRLHAMASTLTVLGEATASSLPNMVEVAQRLPSPSECESTEALMAEVAPPRSPEAASQVEALRQRLQHTEALEYSGRYHDALAEVAALVPEAELIEYSPLLAEVLLVHGRILIKMDRGGDAAETLQRAAVAALSAGMNGVGVEAIARLVYASGAHDHDAARAALILIPFAEALLERAPESAFARGLLLNNTGIVHLRRGQREQAREYFERAVAVKESDPGGHHLELIHSVQNLAMLTTDAARRHELLQRAVHELDRELGELHPMALSVRLFYSRHLASPIAARGMLEPVCAHYEMYHPDLDRKRFECHDLLASVHAELGDEERASIHFMKAATLTIAHTDPWMRASGQIARGYALHYRGEHEDALATFRGAQESVATLLDQWWFRLLAAKAALGMGLAQHALTRGQASIASLDAALGELDALHRFLQDSVLERQQALARLSLAGALLAVCSGADAACRGRASRLLAEAEGWYRSAGPGAEHRLDAIVRLRALRAPSR